MEATTEEDRLYRKKRFRIKPSRMFDVCQEIFNECTTETMLRQVYHSFSTQKNESLNKQVTVVAPKDKTFSLTMSLTDRVNFVVVCSTLGHLVTIRELLRVKNMELPEITREYLERQDKQCEYIRSYNQSHSVQLRRSEKKKADLREQLRDEISDNKLGFLYEPGVAVLGKNGEGGSSNAENQTAQSRTRTKSDGTSSTKATRKCRCGGDDHSRVTHHSCPLNKQRQPLQPVGATQECGIISDK